MTLTELIEQYFQTAQDLTERAKMLNQQLNTLPTNQKAIIKRRINLLCYDAARCRESAKTLAEYIKKENHK